MFCVRLPRLIGFSHKKTVAKQEKPGASLQNPTQNYEQCFLFKHPCFIIHLNHTSFSQNHLENHGRVYRSKTRGSNRSELHAGQGFGFNSHICAFQICFENCEPVDRAARILSDFALKVFSRCFFIALWSAFRDNSQRHLFTCCIDDRERLNAALRSVLKLAVTASAPREAIVT
jgi:hypothetical protein